MILRSNMFLEHHGENPIRMSAQTRCQHQKWVAPKPKEATQVLREDSHPLSTKTGASDFPLNPGYWLFNRDPYSGLLYFIIIPYNQPNGVI